MLMELSHTKGILRMDVELYLVDTWDTKGFSRYSSAVLDRVFARSDREIRIVITNRLAIFAEKTAEQELLVVKLFLKLFIVYLLLNIAMLIYHRPFK